MKKFLISFLVLILSVMLLTPYRVQKVGAVDYKEEIRRENAKLENYKKVYQQAVELEKEQSYKIAGLSDDLANIEKNLVNLGRDKQLLEQEMKVAHAEFLYSLNITERLTQSIEDKEKKRDKIIFILYKNYSLNYTAFLFSSKSINEILDRTIYLQTLIQAHNSYFRNFKEERYKLEQEKIKKVEKQEMYYKKNSELTVRIGEYDAQETKKNQQINLVHLTKEQAIRQQEEAEREMDRSDARIKELLRRQSEEERKRKYGNTPFGKIQWPISGKVTSLFGNRLHPIFGYYRMHSGVDIDADSGTPIHACSNGFVVFAGWLSGYGNVVIIQHNQTHSTVYAHQRVYYVREGQEVKMGDVIGEVGSTGWSTGPHLHFEVRINGDPVNPMNYLP